MPYCRIEIEQLEPKRWVGFIEAGPPMDIKRTGPEQGMRGEELATLLRVAWTAYHEALKLDALKSEE